MHHTELDKFKCQNHDLRSEVKALSTEVKQTRELLVRTQLQLSAKDRELYNRKLGLERQADAATETDENTVEIGPTLH